MVLLCNPPRSANPPIMRAQVLRPPRPLCRRPDRAHLGNDLLTTMKLVFAPLAKGRRKAKENTIKGKENDIKEEESRIRAAAGPDDKGAGERVVPKLIGSRPFLSRSDAWCLHSRIRLNLLDHLDKTLPSVVEKILMVKLCDTVLIRLPLLPQQSLSLPKLRTLTLVCLSLFTDTRCCEPLF